MKKTSITAALVLCMILSPAFGQKKGKYKDYTISGVYMHKNLGIYLVQGKDSIKGKKFITLDEAFENKQIKFHETGNVNKLVIENISGANTIYIQAGDIIKGGKQDRTLKNDVLLPPASGKVNIDSFCVESGRWRKRGNEDVTRFTSSKKVLVSKKQKLAAKFAGSQSEVWKEVSEAQDKLSANMGKDVRDNRSDTSLQLTLEDKDIEKKAKAYMDSIKAQIKGKKEVLGFIYTVNGEINSADVYGNVVLFQKLWPRLLEASAVEAISEYKGKDHARMSIKEVIKWLEDSDKAAEKEKRERDNNDIKVRESAEDVIFETYEKGDDDNYIHKNMIRK